MSQFTGHPYHIMPAVRPSRNNHPLPLSPPETDQESFHAQAVPTTYLVAGAEPDQLAHPTSGMPERSKLQYRKTSALAYQNSGIRDNRDRALSRGSRNLIVVLPPPDFPLDHGQLGNVLSMGPRHRLSQGILMPLFPTMYGQLSAIAREFNFPSTVGLCLYHHITENGITMTPRISDDAWQYLWGHIFESRSPSNGSQQLPISGRVEFDIDLKKARWFDVWLAGTLRDETIAPAPLSHASIPHWREDSRSTFAEEHIVNEDRWDNQTIQSNSRPTTVRHVPRKLSLVDRLDSIALQASYKASQAISPPPNIAHHLSPIPQSAIPQPSKSELHQRVNSWRATALLDPVSMAESYQPVPDAVLGVEAVTPVDEYPLEGEAEADAQEPLNLADFTWSVTSAGPLSPPLDSPMSPYRLPSVHLDRRMEESAPLTPSTATSWGPADDDWLSNVSSIDRLPSPDIGDRMIESAPMTPATATSWGPADDWRSDVSSIDRLPSPDIAYRVLEDAPVNQASAAPWNMVWPWFEVRNVSSSVESYSPWSGMSASPSSWFDVTKAVTVPPTTSYSPWSGMRDQVWPWFELDSAESGASYSPWAIVPAIRTWPWFDIHASGKMGVQSKSIPERSTSVNPWAGMPRFTTGPWHNVSSGQHRDSIAVALNRSGGLKPRYPSLDIYPVAYPYFDIYPAFAEDVKQNGAPSSAGGYPILDIYPAVYPNFNLYPLVACSMISPPEKHTQKSDNVELQTAYPLFNLYPPIYPFNLNSMYPAASVKLSSSTPLPSSYPWLIIYPPVYPYVTPYQQARAEVTRPGEAKDEVVAPIRVMLSPQYPVLDIYLAVYPWNLDTIYPPTKIEAAVSSYVLLRSSYPWLTIYASVYPHVIPYPQASAETTRPGEAKDKVAAPVRVELPSQYPVLDIYPTVYPWNLDTIYPPTKVEGTSDITTRLPSRYPWLCIYPSVYPFVEPYPTLNRTCKSPDSGSWASPKLERVTVNLDRYYPTFDLYPAAYPHFHLYPALPDIRSTISPEERRIDSAKIILNAVSVDLAGTYPYIRPYSPTYPHFDLYPYAQTYAAPDSEDLTRSKFFVSSSTYPFLAIYPPVYPHFDLYPVRAAEPTSREESKATVATSSSYPHLVVYPPVYPHFNLYPGRAAEPTTWKESNTPVTNSPYPYFVIYPPMYPQFILYPGRAAEPTTREESKTPVINSPYPHLVVYPPVYPHFNLYPGRAAELTTREEPKTHVTTSPYPYLVVYPPVYPHFDLYSRCAAEPTTREELKTNVTTSPYPYLVVYPPVYPYLDLYPSIPPRIAPPVASGKSVVRIDHGYPVLNTYPAIYPHFDIYPGLRSISQPLQTVINISCAELQAEVVPSPMVRKTPTKTKTHRQLHDEVFVKRVVWTPSGYVQDLGLPNKPHEELSRGPIRRQPSVQEAGPRLARSRSGTFVNQQTPSSLSLRATQSQVLPHAPSVPPVRIGSPGVPVISESPLRTSQTPPSPTSSLSQAMKSSIIPGMQGRNMTLGNHNEKARPPIKSMFSSFDRPTPPLSPHDPSNLLGRSRSTVHRAAQSLVLQRARAYEQSTAHSRRQSGITSFPLPPLRRVPDLPQSSKT